MKKCPYCAEEIQDKAIVCRYCTRKLTPSWPRLVFLLLLLAGLAFFVFHFKDKVVQAFNDLSGSVQEIGNLMQTVKELIKALKESAGLLNGAQQ